MLDEHLDVHYETPALQLLSTAIDDIYIYIEGFPRILTCCKIKSYMQTPWYKRCYNRLPLQIEEL